MRRNDYSDNSWVGKKFGRLSVLRPVYFRNDNGRSGYHWEAECECGNIKTYSPKKLITGHTKSCGCIRKERCEILTQEYRVKHNGTTNGNERLYNIWNGMKQRCYNAKSKDYKNWGGKGIGICKEWLNDYASFREWACSNGYDESLTIDRINNNGDYCPENCRWVDCKQQARNKTNNVLITINGVTKSRVEWCEELGINYHTVCSRMRKGLTAEDALLKHKQTISQQKIQNIM